MKVCHVCSGHSADDGRVFHRACVSLAQAGYDVHLIARSSAPAGFSMSGVTIHPLPDSAEAFLNVAGPSSRWERLVRRIRVAKLAAQIQPDLFHVHEPELLGPVIARAGSRPVIWDVHESYLDVLMERRWIPDWLKPLARGGWDLRERQLLKRCAAVVVVTDRIAARYRRLHERVVVVANYPELPRLPSSESPARDGAACVFAGNLRPDRGILEIVRAVGILKKRGLEVPLELAGRPVSESYLTSLLETAAQLGVGHLVRYHGLLSKADADALVKRASIGLVTYLHSANSMAGAPNKIFECMGAGLPVVFSGFPGYREIAETSEAGIPVDPTKPEEIASAIERLVQNPEDARRMGQNGLRAVRARYNWEAERTKLLELYGQILGEPPLRRVEVAKTPGPRVRV